MSISGNRRLPSVTGVRTAFSRSFCAVAKSEAGAIGCNVPWQPWYPWNSWDSRICNLQILQSLTGFESHPRGRCPRSMDGSGPAVPTIETLVSALTNCLTYISGIQITDEQRFRVRLSNKPTRVESGEQIAKGVRTDERLGHHTVRISSGHMVVRRNASHRSMGSPSVGMAIHVFQRRSMWCAWSRAMDRPSQSSLAYQRHACGSDLSHSTVSRPTSRRAR
jgi:hypothetical protein